MRRCDRADRRGGGRGGIVAAEAAGGWLQDDRALFNRLAADGRAGPPSRRTKAQKNGITSMTLERTSSGNEEGPVLQLIDPLRK